jgi:endo-1,4-beta-xylanase
MMKRNLINRGKSSWTWIVFVAFALAFSTQVYAQTDTVQMNVPPLKLVYASDFYIGCLLSYPHIGFPDDPPVPGQSAIIAPNGGNLIKFHMNSMSPGNNMKPQFTVNIAASAAAYNAAAPGAERDSADTHPVVRFNGNLIAQLNWAQRQGFTFRGHTLVWHSQTPGTSFFRSGYTNGGARLSKEKMAERMDNYIKEVIRLLHEGWPGLLTAMDVVNEAVNDNGADRTTDSEWYVTFGDNSYLMKAFEFTRKWTVAYGETQIKLYYNDYNTHNPGKADGIVRICTPIFQAGYLDGIGMQDHDSNFSPTAEQWIASYDKFDPICTEMAVTELDVTTGSANPSPAVLATQANQYGQLFKCFVERSYLSGRGKIINVSKDGLNDQYTFRTNQSSSLWDAQYQCKPAFFAVVEVGINYNALDSLISASDSLQASEYTTDSWANFAAALTAAQAAMAEDYSASVSAAEALGEARHTLQAAVEGLVKIVTGVETPDNGSPKSFVLGQNYPNPFNPATWINYSVPQNGYISLKVYNLLGEEVATLFEGSQLAGNYVVSFDGTQLVNGVYLYQLKANNYKETKKLTLLK